MSDTDLVNQIEEVKDKLIEQQHYERQELWHHESWSPPFVNGGSGWKVLDLERAEMDEKSWQFYRAGLVEGYGQAIAKLEMVLDDDEE